MYLILSFQFLVITPLTIQTISAVAIIMMVVSLLFIPNPLCSLWVMFSIVSIEVGVIGYMSLWGVNLDCISMINLILCIGFSVDFSAHISYAYLTADVDSPSKRVQECMYSLGFPIIQSGLSTIAGVIVFIFVPSYVFLTFFKIIFMVILFGSMHALFLLPVMLSLLGPGSCSKQPVNVSHTISHVSTAKALNSKQSKKNVFLQSVSPILEESSVESITVSSSSSLSSTRASKSSRRGHDRHRETAEACDASNAVKVTKSCSNKLEGTTNLAYLYEPESG